MKQHRMIWLIIALVVAFLGVATYMMFLNSAIGGNSSIQRTSTAEEFTLKAMLQIIDFPQGWLRGDVGDDATPGAILGRSVGFHGARDPNLMWVLVGQYVYVYSTTETTAQAFAQWTAKNFPGSGSDGWHSMPELEFSNHADQMRIACLDVLINGTPVETCELIAQYHNVIMIVTGNVLKDRWLTMADFQSILKAADRRIITAFQTQN